MADRSWALPVTTIVTATMPSSFQHCAFHTCRKRSDQARFRQPRPLTVAMAEHLPHLFDTGRSGVLCNQHYHAIKRQWSQPADAVDGAAEQEDTASAAPLTLVPDETHQPLPLMSDEADVAAVRDTESLPPSLPNEADAATAVICFNDTVTVNDADAELLVSCAAAVPAAVPHHQTATATDDQLPADRPASPPNLNHPSAAATSVSSSTISIAISSDNNTVIDTSRSRSSSSSSNSSSSGSMQNSNSRAPRNKKRKARSASPTVRQVAPMAVSGWRADSATATALRRLQREHGRLTADTWNSSGDHLVWQRREDYLDVSITNGEMQQQPFCELIQMLRTHPNIPLHARLGHQHDDQRQPQHLFCDVGSGYGLAVLRAHILLRKAAMCAGIEIAQDRVNISVRLAAHMQEDMPSGSFAQFVAGAVEDADVLPILLASTHLFAYSAVFSSATRDYIAANVLRRDDSLWLVYVTFDSLTVFERAGLIIHTEPHGPDCSLGGAHLLGRTKSLPMAVSKQKLTANILLRCQPPASSRARDETWQRGIQLLNQRAAAAELHAHSTHAATIAHQGKRVTRSQKSDSSTLSP